MKKGWIIFISIVVIVIAVVAIVGGKMYMDNKKLDEDMKEVVRSNESLIEKELETYDTHNKIKNVSFDYGTVEKSPLGGILFQGYVNNDKELTFNAGLQKKWF
ncbi:DUF1310 family protein [Listeria aquatica]|uniref:DUF1433 domain-containing protein n=1 Tax=Listeria aquatica FSL S10-1188 TaxID=1265818 RepID=W7B705_9LIST|nr:DUF1310 family protein [Listeria aquatica]EUJ18636.1 hypothetical protein MAQA_08627 [Listeria aquatica FSL S10-1188]